MRSERRWPIWALVLLGFVFPIFLLFPTNRDEATKVAVVEPVITKTPHATIPLSPTITPTFLPTETAVSAQPTVHFTPTSRPTNTAVPISPSPQPTFTPLPPPPDWLIYLNQFRSEANLPLLLEDMNLSQGSTLHSEYMTRNDNGIARTQDIHNRFFTEVGRTAAQNGNIYATTSIDSNYVWATNFWMSAPFHAVPILDPYLETVGYGNFRDDLGRVRIAAVLDVESGLRADEENVAYPITFPKDGGETWVLKQSLLEYPEPLTSCPGYQKPAGPPLIVQIGDGSKTPNVTGARLWAGGRALNVCVFDETSYSNPDGMAQANGRLILDERDAIILIPQEPLEAGLTYTAEVDVSGEMVRWAFTAVSSPQIEAGRVELADFVNYFPIEIRNIAFGGQTHDLNHPYLMHNVGMSWVKYQLKWRTDSKPEELVGRIQHAKALGFNVMVSVTGDPYPESIDFDAFTQFMAGVAALNPPPDAIEVWNEMNIDFEWPAGQIDPAQYVNQMLAPSYEAIKAINPRIVVISGAPAPTGFDDSVHAWSVNRYVDGMAAAGAQHYMDCIGVHYNEGATSPFDTTGHPAGGYFGWYYQPSLDMYFYAFDGIRPLCITELGILSGEGYEALPSRFSWAQNTTAEQQGRWLVEAISLAEQSGYVKILILFNVDIFHWGVDPQAGFAIIRPGGACPFCELMLSNR